MKSFGLKEFKKTHMKKIIILSISLVFLFVNCTNSKKKTEDNINSEKEIYMFTSFHEPADEGLRFLYSYDGYHWDSIPGVFLKPEVGVEKIMRDPSIIVGSDSTYHLVWTCSWKKDPAFGYSSSKDLINWTTQQHIPIMAHEPTTVNVWAPELFYDDEKGDFFIVWASTIPYRFETGIEAEENNHRLYYTQTKDFKEFTTPEVIYDPGYNSIDATIVKKGKNDYVMVFKDNTRPNRHIEAAFASSPAGPYSNKTEPFTESFTEGPTVVKVGDEWLIYYDAYRKFSYDAVSTTDFQTFTNINDKISVPKNHKHGTIFKTTEKILNNLKASKDENK